MTRPLRLLAVDLNACRAPQQEPYRRLAAAGLEVHLVVPSAWQEPHGLARAHISSGIPGLTVTALPVIFNGRYHRVLFRGLGGLIRRWQPDRVWAHAEPENFLAGQCLAALRGSSARLTLVSWRNIDYGRGGLPYKLAWLHQWLEDRSLRAGVEVLCYNREALALMRGLGFDAQPTRMGVSLEHFTPGSRVQARRQLGLPVGGRWAGFAGRFQDEKGVADLIEAAARIRGLKVLLVGDGPAKAAWQDLARGRGVTLTVLTLPHERMPLAMRALDVFVLPSKSTPAWKEQFGRVLVEAMACGTAVVGSDSGAIPDVVGRAGRVFPEGDQEALERCLREALRQPRRAACLARAERYSWRAITPGLVRYFKSEVRTFSSKV